MRQAERVSARRLTSVVVLAAAAITSCSSSRSANRVATSQTSSPVAKSGFCDLYRRDAGNGKLRNWDLNDNGKTPTYTETLRGLADAAPPELKPDIERILSYYAASQPHVSPADYQAGLQSGERVLKYVHNTCEIDTNASPPPGDTASTTP
jgi:hypothetical protein